eukprot:4417674-Pyramimonas_sp.AAC.1
MQDQHALKDWDDVGTTGLPEGRSWYLLELFWRPLGSPSRYPKDLGATEPALGPSWLPGDARDTPQELLEIVQSF